MTHRWTLGINHSIHESAACLLYDTEIVFATAEERLSRQKQDSSFPERAILAALDYASISFADVSAVGLSFPARRRMNAHNLMNVITGNVPRSRSNMADALGRSHTTGPLARLGKIPTIHAIGHHRSHAWSAGIMTDVPQCAVLVADGRGARNSTSIWKRHGEKMEMVDCKRFPDSLGLFYGKITQYLGFQPLADDWKVMGLAPFGSPGIPMDRFIQVSADDYKVNGKALVGKSFYDLSALSHEFGPPRKPDDPIDDHHRDIAWAAQEVVERAILALARRAVRGTGFRTVAFAGGVALNCKANGLLISSGIVDDLVVQPAAGDDGSALGAAIDAYHRIGGIGLPRPLTSTGLGQDASDDDIEGALRTYKVNYRRVDNPDRAAAERLAVSKVVGWFQGRSEFGPRALGYRSILADPRDVRMRDVVNAAVKFRESWRPFAPSVLAEHAADLFRNCESSPFMVLAFDATLAGRESVPAVIHVDGTSRVQAVVREANPLYYDLLRRFFQLTGVPAVMNTSFNLKGDPIVNTIRDAIQTFFSSGLDSLVIGRFVIDKDNQANGSPTL